MNSTSYDLNTSVGIRQMSEAILENNSNQPLITTNDIDLINEEKHLLSNQDNSSSNPIDNVPIESSPSNITKKQKSLISVYDNSNDGEQQQQQQQQQINQNSFPLVGILGRNQRSQAFTKRLLLSSFPKPILCDINSTENDLNEKSNYISYERFLHQSPSIILITDNLPNNFEHFFNLNKQQLIIDVRELNFQQKNSSHLLISIPDCYQAFGNLSNWEIENGTQRIGVAIEQSSPINLIKFIHNLNCFSRGIYFVDQYTYNNEQMKSFRNCLFPFLSTILIFCLWFIFSMIEYRNNNKNYYQTDFLYRQASSITAATSLTLLSLLFLIRPLLELIEWILQKLNQKEDNFISRSKFIQRWLQSRRYLAWYSLSFAFLHFIFIIISKNDFNQKTFFYPIFLGVIALILLCILSFVYFPWISERLLWKEYRLLTSYLGPFAVLIALIHVFIHWKYDYYHYYKYDRSLFQIKFFSMFLPFVVLLLRFIIYGLINPIKKLIQIRERITKTSIQTKKDTTFFP